MKDKIHLVVDYIEEHYHDDITYRKIEELTAESFQTFKNEFQKWSGMRIEVYKLRRQLTLIKEEMMKLNLTLDDMDISPFENQLIYSFYFQCEFAISIEAAVKHKHLSLQPKYGSSEWKKYDSVIFRILEKYRPNEALRYLLSLPPCFLDASTHLDFYSSDVTGLGYKRIYPQVPLMKDLIGKLRDVYTSEKSMMIKDSQNRKIRYAIVNRNLIYKLILEHEAKVEYSPLELTTLWADLTRENMPFNIELPAVSESIIKALLEQDFGKISFETIEELRTWIHVDFSKPIKIRKKGEEGIPQEYYYEELKIETLIKNLNELLTQGLLYIKEIDNKK
jgi:AraC-like DNA-binding protein